jgi:hypothetical protein
MKKNVELLASYWTLAVDAVPHTGPEHSSASFADRVAAAARAGFTGMGLWHADLEHTLRTTSLGAMRRILEEHGIRHIELEFLYDWWYPDSPQKTAFEARKKMLFEAAAELGAHHVKVGDFFNTPCPMPQLIESFAALCREGARYGTQVHFELMPFANINTLPNALALVQGADAPNGGIIIDLWHVVKLGIPYADVAAIPSRFLGGIEINDGRLISMPELTEETTQHRNLCGEGEFDVKGFVSTMLNAGYQGPWGIEVLNHELRRQPLEHVAQRAAATTFAQFPD